MTNIDQQIITGPKTDQVKRGAPAIPKADEGAFLAFMTAAMPAAAPGLVIIPNQPERELPQVQTDQLQPGKSIAHPSVAMADTEAKLQTAERDAATGLPGPHQDFAQTLLPLFKTNISVPAAASIDVPIAGHPLPTVHSPEQQREEHKPPITPIRTELRQEGSGSGQAETLPNAPPQLTQNGTKPLPIIHPAPSRAEVLRAKSDVNLSDNSPLIAPPDRVEALAQKSGSGGAPRIISGAPAGIGQDSDTPDHPPMATRENSKADLAAKPGPASDHGPGNAAAVHFAPRPIAELPVETQPAETQIVATTAVGPSVEKSPQVALIMTAAVPQSVQGMEHSVAQAPKALHQNAPDTLRGPATIVQAAATPEKPIATETGAQARPHVDLAQRPVAPPEHVLPPRYMQADPSDAPALPNRMVSLPLQTQVGAQLPYADRVNVAPQMTPAPQTVPTIPSRSSDTDVSPDHSVSTPRQWVETVGMTTTQSATPTTNPHSSAPVPQHPPVPVSAIPTIIKDQAASGKSRTIEIALAPDELGQIRLVLQPDGDKMRIVVQAERPETLELLRRNTETFSAELRQSGFANSSFSFGGWGESPSKFGKAQQDGNTPAVTTAHNDEIPPPAAASRPVTGLDLRV